MSKKVNPLFKRQKKAQYYTITLCNGELLVTPDILDKAIKYYGDDIIKIFPHYYKTFWLA